MDFYFTDRKRNLIEVATTDGDTGFTLTGDADKESIDAATRSFTTDIVYPRGQASRAAEMGAVGNFIIFWDSARSETVLMEIVESTHDPKAMTQTVIAEDDGADLLDETVGAYTADKAYTIADYIARFTEDSGWQIGINEIANLTRTLKWESEEETATARLLSVATQFDNAELRFSYGEDGTKYINVYKHRGSDKGTALYLNRDIDNITTSANIYDLMTSVKATGGTPEGADKPITLAGYKWTDPDGRYVLTDGGWLEDTVANQTWSRILTEAKAHYINRTKTYTATTQVALLNSALAELKQNATPAVNYTVDIAILPDGVEIGDTLHIVNGDESEYLSARVLELTRCYSTGTATATLGDYLIETDQVSANVRALADQMEQIKLSQYYPWVRYADDDQGTGMTSLAAGKSYMAITWSKNAVPSDDPADYAGKWTLIKGADGKDGSTGVAGPAGIDGKTPYVHTAYANSLDGATDFSVTDGDGKTYFGQYIDFTEDDSTDPTKYNWARFKGDQGIKGDNGADGTPGAKGADGKSSYLHTAYAQSADGKTGFSVTDATGATYIGVYSDAVEADSADPAKYTWMQAQGPTGPQGAKGETGAAGKDGATGTPGAKGADGKTPYVHYAYATSADGKSGFSVTPAATSTYIGVCTDYASADPTDATKYTWSKFVGPQGATGAKGETGATGKTGATGPAGPQGPKGDAGSKDVPMTYVQTAQPTGTPVVGSIWWVGNSLSTVTAIKRWDGKVWVTDTIAQEVLNIKTLNAITINGSTITGSEYLSNYTKAPFVSDDNKTGSGVMQINGAEFLTHGKVDGEEMYYAAAFGPSGFTMETASKAVEEADVKAGEVKSYGFYGYDSFMLKDSANNIGAMNAELLEQINNVGNLLWSGAWTMAGSTTCTPSKAITDCFNGWVVVWSYGKTNAGQNSDWQYQFIPKSAATSHNGAGVGFPLHTNSGGHKTQKYLYVTKTTLKGHDNNTKASDSADFVMREVREW